METMVDKQQLLNERIVETSFTTSLFKAYRQTYNSSEEINISIPPSRQMVNLADIVLYFRPLVKYQQSGDLTQFQNSQRCLTAINAQNHLTISSITFNNNEVLAQPRQNNQFARTILDQYMLNFLKTKPVKTLSADGIQLTTSFMMQSSSAMNVYNVLENQICVPANGLFSHPSMQKVNADPVATGNAGLYTGSKDDVRDRCQNSSNFEGSYKPRAIVSQLYNYYYNCNIPPTDKVTSFGTSYYEQKSGINLGNVRIGANPDGDLPATFGDASSLPNNLDASTFPNLSRAITPSISIYKRQQESFMSYRQRFIQIQVGPYEDPSIPFKEGAQCVMPDQSQGFVRIADSAANKGFDNLEKNGPDGDSLDGGTRKTLQLKADAAKNLRVMSAKAVDCRFSYGVPVQQQSDQVYSRFEGKVWSETDTTLLNPERYTTVAVRLGDISSELEQIGLICMEKTRVDISIYVNTPACCLSSYVQPSLILDSLNSVASGPTAYEAALASQALQGTVQYYKKFIDLCQIGSGVSLTLNDLVMRIETHNYSQNAYALVKEMLFAPKPYSTFRMASKPILADGPMSIPLNLGTSSTVRCLLYWIVPRANKFTAVQTKRSQHIDNALPQDAMVDYSGCQGIQRGDIRSTILDSYYIPHESFVSIDNEIFNKTQIPLQDPQLSQYLLTQTGLVTALNRHLNIDLQSFLHNRFIGVIAIDPTGSRKFISQMLDFTINIDSKDRVNYAKTFNLHCRSINDQFDIIIAALVGQTLVECQRVMI